MRWPTSHREAAHVGRLAVFARIPSRRCRGGSRTAPTPGSGCYTWVSPSDEPSRRSDLTTNLAPVADTSRADNSLLEEIQNRVLWLACHMVDYANNERPNPTGLKVGGHQASSASVVTVMTYLFFEYMRAGDRISVKPHSSPVYHAIQYLLGNLDAEYLKALRGFHGLQAYPSRTKDPDGVDFSTGSVGLGAVAPNWAWLAEEYVRDHLDPNSGPDRRFISLIGDAELDEGVVWEAIADPSLADTRNVLWVVDLNRQSLDRIVPGIRVKVWREMFEANGWKVVDAKYGRKLQAAFAEPNGGLLRDAIDDMSNDLYQRLLRVDGPTLREWLPRASRRPDDMAELLGRWDDDELSEIFHDLGGHDFDVLREAFDELDLESGPNVLFAYTLKGWRLPTIGHPQNHSATLNRRQMAQLRENLGVPEDETVARLRSDTPAGRLCLDRGFDLQLSRRSNGAPPQIDVPTEFGRSYNGRMSTQQIFGLVLTELSREHRAPPRAGRDRQPGRGQLHQPGGLDQPGRACGPSGPRRSSRRSSSGVRSDGTSPRRAATSSWAYPRTTCSWRWASSASPTR